MVSKLVFLFGCLGTRLFLSLLARNKKYLPYLSIFTSIVGLSFIYLYITNSRKFGIETEGPIWWVKLRPLHGILYLLFSIYAYKQESFSWLILLVDTMIGGIAWANQHYYI